MRMRVRMMVLICGVCVRGSVDKVRYSSSQMFTRTSKPPLIGSGMVRMFWQEQKQALTTADMRSMRWSPQCIRLALAVYIRSKSA